MSNSEITKTPSKQFGGCGVFIGPYGASMGGSQRGLPLFYPDEFVGVIAAAFGFGENERLGGVLQLRRARENPQVVLIASAY